MSMTEWDMDFIRQFSLTITCDDTAHRIVGRLRPFSGLNTRDTGETRNVYVKDYQTVVFSFFLFRTDTIFKIASSSSPLSRRH